jgi:hypothetical protein
MPLAIRDVDTLKRYVEGVMGRSEHHGGNVGGAALALVGAIVWRKIRVKIGGQRYAFSYNHGERAIAMRKGITQER